LCLGAVLLWAGAGSAQSYSSLEGVESIKAVFDVRDDNPENVLVHLQLVHDSYNDEEVRSTDGKPDFAVVFMDLSVTLLSQDREGFTDQEKETLEKIDALLEKMAAEGIVLEVCLFATDFFELDPESFHPAIEPVPNGWIASMGYQAKGYSLIPVY
jgi:intracellular sulfur oxidation DsrE/DsrF family protein